MPNEQFNPYKYLNANLSFGGPKPSLNGPNDNFSLYNHYKYNDSNLSFKKPSELSSDQKKMKFTMNFDQKTLVDPSSTPPKKAGKFKDKLGTMSTSGITDVGLNLLDVDKTGANTMFDAVETPLNSLVPGLGTGLSILSKANSVLDQKLASKYGIAKDLNLNTGLSGYSDDSVKGTKSLSSGFGADVLHTILPFSRLFGIKKGAKKVDKARAERLGALKTYSEKQKLAGVAKQQMEAANQSMQNVGITNQNQLNNLDYGAALMAKEGGVLQNVIPSGALHAHKHSLDIEGITKKGIPVISEDGGELVQHAEIEREEVVLTLSLTEKLEVFRKEKNALEAGRLLATELMENTVDNTDLTEKLFGNEN